VDLHQKFQNRTKKMEAIRVSFLIKKQKLPHSGLIATLNKGYLAKIMNRQVSVSKTALIVDDSSTARLLLSKVLRNRSIRSRESTSGEAALDTLKTFTPDFIFLDHIMPGMDGFQVLKKIKAMPDYQHIPVIMYTSQNALKYYEEAHTLGATGVISKQIDQEKLYLMIDRLCLNERKKEKDKPLVGLLESTEEDIYSLNHDDSKQQARISTLESAYENLHEEHQILEQKINSLQNLEHQANPKLSENKRWLLIILLTITVFLSFLAWYESYQFNHLLLQLSGRVNVQHDLIKEIINLLENRTR
jgi:CheY-like chemotaxis protein